MSFSVIQAHFTHFFKEINKGMLIGMFPQKNKRGATFIRNTRVRARCWYDMRCWLRSEHKMLRGCAPDQVHNMLAHDNRWSQLLFWSGVFPYIGKFYIFQKIRCTQNCSIQFIIFGTNSWPEFFKYFDRNSGRNRANFASYDAHFLLSLRSKYVSNKWYISKIVQGFLLKANLQCY